ncbi:MAG: bacillithiol biosynthesis BshC [Planctomycetota bacterium]|nr:bacillithiol biosynthesis BshC [Planctomycetota bacterium]
MPQGDDAWRAALEAAEEATQPIPTELVARLVERQRALGAGELAAWHAEVLGSEVPRTVAVVTGQQPGLLGGPLLTYHKVAGAIALAKYLDSLTDDLHVVPVYWLASEDHDFDEANRTGVIARDGQLRTLKVDAQGDGRSIADLDVSLAAREAFMGALAEALPDTDRAREAAALVAPREGESFATWSARALIAVFGNSGLVVVEPEVLDAHVAPTYGRLLDHAAEIGAAVSALGPQLTEVGMPAPLAPEPGATPLFYREEPGGPRLRVSLDPDGGIRLRDEPAGFDAEELKRRLTQDPRLGAGNVMGRVFVQNAHLPVLAYIAGPTEIAYHAQLKAAATALGKPYPLALPRPEATWVRARDAQTASDFGFTLGQVLKGEQPDSPSTEPTLAAGGERLRRILETLGSDEADLAGAGGRTKDALRRMRERLLSSFDKAWAGVEKAAAADQGVGRARFERLRAGVRPTGKPQERLLCPISLIARYGLEPVRAGLLSLDPLVPAHQLVWIGEENETP